MDMKIYLTNGEAHTLRTDSTAGEQIVSALKPARFFDRSALQVQGKQATITFNPSAIEWVIFDAPEGTSWFEKFLTSLEPAKAHDRVKRSFQWVTQDEYAQLRQTLGSESPSPQSGRAMEHVAQMRFNSGRTGHVYAKGSLGPGEDPRRFTLNVFDMPSLVARCKTTGFVLINPKTIEALVVTPTLTEPSPLVWKAEYIVQ